MRRVFSKLLLPSFEFVSELPFDKACIALDKQVQKKLVKLKTRQFPSRKVTTNHTGHGHAEFRIELDYPNPNNPSKFMWSQSAGFKGSLIAHGENQTIVRGRGFIAPFMSLVSLIFFVAGLTIVTIALVTHNVSSFGVVWGIGAPIMAIFLHMKFVNTLHTVSEIIRSELRVSAKLPEKNVHHKEQ
jgi:hypothetical protein